MTAIGAVLVKNKKVINTIVVDTSDGVTANGYTPPEGSTVHILPFGSQVTFGWDYVNGEFYSPLPTSLELQRGESVELPYQVSGTYLSGVTFTGTTLSASVDAQLGDFTLTLTDPGTGRTSECIVSIKEASPTE